MSNKTRVVPANFHNSPSTVRLKLSVQEFWRDDYKDKSSDEYKNLAASLKVGIEDLYKGESKEKGEVMARVVEARWVGGMDYEVKSRQQGFTDGKVEAL